MNRFDVSSSPLLCLRCGGYQTAVCDGNLGLHCSKCGVTEWRDSKDEQLSQAPLAVVEALFVHQLTDRFAAWITEIGRRQPSETHPRPFAGGAIHCLSQDARVLHRSTRSLCMAGWVASAPLLLRAEFEILTNSAVIWNSGPDIEYMAFKYTHYFLVDTYRDQASSKEMRSRAKSELEKAIVRLPEEVRKKAREFAFHLKVPAYWYSPEVSGPTDAIKRFARSDVMDLYRSLSSSAHGGYLGLRLFRDDPDAIHAEARADPLAVTRALLGSSLFTIDQAHIRALIDGSICEKEYEEVRDVVIHYGEKVALQPEVGEVDRPKPGTEGEEEDEP